MTNSECRMTNVKQTEKHKVFDLEERCSLFSEHLIDFVRTVPKDAVTIPIISQLVRCATSIGANYCEANDAESKKDFKHKIGISRKESHETMYWLRGVVRAVPSCAGQAKVLWQEAKELNLIFSKIVRTTENSLVEGKK